MNKSCIGITMDEVCRLCLKVSDEMACKLGKDPKIELCCLNIQLHDSLPSNVCYICFNALVDIQSFKETVMQNENKLKKLLKNGNLNDFYESLRNKYVIEIEITKTEGVNKNNDMFYDDQFYAESFYPETLDKSDVKCDVEINKNELIQVTIKTENVTEDNNIPNSNIPNSKERAKIKTKQLTNAKKKRVDKSNEKRNCVQTKTNIQSNEIKVLDTEPHLPSKPPEDEKNADFNNTEHSEGSEGVLIGTEDIKIKDHKCLTCFKNLISQLELIKHYKLAHNNYNNKDLENRNETEFAKITPEKQEAKKKHSGNKNKEEIVRSVTSENPERPYICGICGRTFNCVHAIVRHGRAHSDVHLHCSRGCGYTTVYKGALRDHEKRHEKDFKYKCATCGAGFHVKTWYDQHQNIHKKIKPFVCDICGKAFHMNRYLTSHRTTRHPDYVTNGGTRYICPRCDLAFNNKHAFKTHMEEHNGKRLFLCDLCGKVCATGEQLKHHNNFHLGLKPFSCSICNKKFAKKFNLTIHEKAHAGEKHLCQACGKYFAQRSTLLRHNRKCHPDNDADNTDKNSTENNKVLSLTNY